MGTAREESQRIEKLLLTSVFSFLETLVRSILYPSWRLRSEEEDDPQVDWCPAVYPLSLLYFFFITALSKRKKEAVKKKRSDCKLRM